MIIAVDFDGVICNSAYPALGDAMPGVRKAIKELRERGHYVIVWTCRTGEPLLQAINWMREQRISFDRVNDHSPENLAEYGEGGKKIYADVYIDDKNLGGFDGWFAAMDRLRELPEY